MKIYNLTQEVVKNPIVSTLPQWSGEKMILIPQLASKELNTNWVRSLGYQLLQYNKFGVVALCPSFKTCNEYSYSENDSLIVDSTNIESAINALKNKIYNRLVVFANRYDGLNLPDDLCRVLILDGKPYFENLSESYEMESIENSEIVNLKLAQKIEQGIGRAVRGEKDYCVILLTGEDLVRFATTRRYQQYLSKQTLAQLNLGVFLMDVVKSSPKKEEEYDSEIVDMLFQSVNRNADWKNHYIQYMNNEFSKEKANGHTSDFELVEKENRADVFFSNNQFANAIRVYSEICNTAELAVEEKGWYQQKLAKCLFFNDQLKEANSLQKSAKRNNNKLLMPRDGSVDSIRKIVLDDTRITNLLNLTQQKQNNNVLRIHVESVLDKLSFGPSSKDFEHAFMQLGELLGYASSRPDHKFKKGPDNLWDLGSNNYVIFECKSACEETHTTISKRESGQMHNHHDWIKAKYPNCNVTIVWVHVTNVLSKESDFNHEAYALMPQNLSKLKTHVLSLYIDLLKSNIASLTRETVSETLSAHGMLKASFLLEYLVGIEAEDC